MKKTLIALAALAATGAFAQSTVTLYGVADVAFGKIDEVLETKAAVAGDAATGKAYKPATYALGLSNDKFQAIGSNTLNNGNSRFGLKGTEDLGGGLKAGFNFEGGVDILNGAGNTSGGNLFSRAANVSLLGNFGEVRAGRTLTTSFYSVAAWELTGTANYSVVANQFSFGGAGSRDSAVLMYNSPVFSGFSFSGSFVNEGNAVVKNDAKADASKYDLSATYANGPLVASIAYNKTEDGQEGTVLGGKYNFGPVAVAASYTKSETDAGVTLAKGYSLGASGKVGPVNLTLDVARDTEFSDTDFVLEAKYPLSKRTFVYGVYMRDGKGKTAVDVNGYAVGLRHNF